MSFMDKNIPESFQAHRKHKIAIINSVFHEAKSYGMKLMKEGIKTVLAVKNEPSELGFR